MIYIVRHGQTDWNLKGIYQGRIDVPLNKTGIEQAKETKQEIAGITFDKVFSSPLKRAYETALIICDNPIIKDERIAERSNGELEGKLKVKYKDAIDFNNEDETNRFGIESITDFRKRINSFFDEITANYKNKNILVVTHAGVSIYARCYFEGEPTDGDYTSYKLKNCKVLKYEN